MRTPVKTIEYDQDGVTASITVAAATVRMGIERTLMQYGARQLAQDDSPEVGLLRRMTWPDLMAATTGGEIDGRPVIHLTFQEWLELPESLVISWEKAVYELNPHWLPPRNPPAMTGGSPNVMS